MFLSMSKWVFSGFPPNIGCLAKFDIENQCVFECVYSAMQWTGHVLPLCSQCSHYSLLVTFGYYNSKPL